MCFVVQTVQEQVYEIDERFSLSLSTSDDAVSLLGVDQATVTINDDDQGMNDNMRLLYSVCEKYSVLLQINFHVNHAYSIFVMQLASFCL